MPETPLMHWQYPDEYQPDWYLGANGHVQLFTAIDYAVGNTSTVLNVKSFGALGDGTDDTVAIQAAINSIDPGNGFGYGNVIWFPAGRYRISNQLVIDRQCTLAGCGPSSHIMQDNAAANILFISAIGSPVTEAPYPDNSKQVTIRDLALSYETQGAPGTACIYSDPGGPAGLYGYMTYGNRFINLDISRGYDCIHFERGAYFTIDRCFISNATRYTIYIRNLTSPTSGDSRISNCLFIDRSPAGTQTQAHIFFRSGGGLSIVNCKGLWGNYFFDSDVESNTGTMNIANCSVGGNHGGMRFVGNSGVFIGLTVVGCGVDSEAPTPLTAIELVGQFQVVTIAGNNLYLSQDNGTGVKVGTGALGVNISGNQFMAYAGANQTGIDIGAGVQYVTIHGNAFHGTFTRRFVNLSSAAQVHYHDGTASFAMTSGDTATESNFTAIRDFNKVITIPADLMNFLGARIHVHMAGRLTSMAGAPGTIILAVNVHGVQYQAPLAIPMTASLSGQGWSIDSYLTVVATGVGGILQDGGGWVGIVGSNPSVISTSNMIPVDLTAAVTIRGSVQYSVANAANSANMTTALVTITPATHGTV